MRSAAAAASQKLLRDLEESRAEMTRLRDEVGRTGFIGPEKERKIDV